MNNCNAYTLGEIVEKYCIRLFNDKRKGYINFLSMAKDVWESVFLRTLWVYQQEWVDVRSGNGEPYPYIVLPVGSDHLIGIYDVDDCGKEVRLYINNAYSILPKPAIKQCGCKSPACNCGDNCSAVNSFTFTTKEISFENDIVNEAGAAVLVGGTTFLEKTWIEKCENGDIVQWKESPVIKKLTTPINISAVNYYEKLDYVKVQKRLCTIELLPCGCVDESELNANKLVENCGCNILFTCNPKSQLRGIDADMPEVKFSSCGKKAYIIGATKSQYLTKSQSYKACENSMVPREAANAIMTGIDWESKRFNPLSKGERREAKLEYRASQYELIEFHNPINLETMDRIHNQEKKW